MLVHMMKPVNNSNLYTGGRGRTLNGHICNTRTTLAQRSWEGCSILPHDSRRENILCVKLRPKVHPEMNSALLCQTYRSNTSTPWREEKSSELHWEAHPVVSTPTAWKFSKVIMAKVQNVSQKWLIILSGYLCFHMWKSEQKCVLIIIQPQLTCWKYVLSLFCFSCIWNAYSKESYCVPSFTFMSTFFSWKLPFSTLCQQRFKLQCHLPEFRMYQWWHCLGFKPAKTLPESYTTKKINLVFVSLFTPHLLMCYQLQPLGFFSF